MKKHKSDKSRLVKRHLEHWPVKGYKYALGKKNRGIGIYILYRGKKVYYIGLSKSSLRSRIRKHALRDHHKGHWNNFSFYQIGRKKYIKDIESLLLRVFRPKGNRVGGKFRKNYNLAKRLRIHNG